MVFLTGILVVFQVCPLAPAAFSPSVCQQKKQHFSLCHKLPISKFHLHMPFVLANQVHPLVLPKDYFLFLLLIQEQTFSHFDNHIELHHNRRLLFHPSRH